MTFKNKTEDNEERGKNKMIPKESRLALLFLNYFRTDLRIMLQYRRKIEKTRFQKLIGCVCDSILHDCINPEDMERSDKMFEPRTEAEAIVWNMYRELAKKDIQIMMAKIEKGGRPKTKKEEKSI